MALATEKSALAFVPHDELSSHARRQNRLGCFCAAVAMMKTADAKLRVDLACFGRGLLYFARSGCGLLQRDVSAILVVVREIFTPEPSEMVFVQRDDVISQFPASTANPAFRDSVLPRASYTCSDRVDAARVQKGDNMIAELGVSIEHDITTRAGKGSVNLSGRGACGLACWAL